MKALVIGATGMVGRELVQLLLNDDYFQKIVVFGRRTLGIDHKKLDEHMINFDNTDEWQHLVTGDILFSTLGTTLKQAGSKENQYKIDYTYQYEFADAASKKKVPVYVLVSAASANPGSRFFYTRMKGELERDVKKMIFKAIHIIQPGFLHGHRDKERAGEKLILNILNSANSIGLLNKYRPVHGKTVAKAMIQAARSDLAGIFQYELEEVFELASSESP
ncbi:MAG: NAD-dependent epimerase/dehydratase family protein [Balneolaceae bacterium]|nr:MAG: NAD-dependent epimerase/dehydratase family protein [Balneolaceae bacterium]